MLVIQNKETKPLYQLHAGDIVEILRETAGRWTLVLPEGYLTSEAIVLFGDEVKVSDPEWMSYLGQAMPTYVKLIAK